MASRVPVAQMGAGSGGRKLIENGYSGRFGDHVVRQDEVLRTEWVGVGSSF